MSSRPTGANIAPVSDTQNIVIEHLKRIQAELSAARDRDAELLLRLANIETIVARFGRHESQNYAELVDGCHELDKLKSRVDRIERRLEIID